MKSNLHTLFVFCLILFACENGVEIKGINPDALFTKVESRKSGIKFNNALIENFQNCITRYDYYYNGAGVALGDINNDDLIDIFFTSNTGKNALYLNKGNLEFENISLKSGIQSLNKWSNGVTIIDVNGDGFKDIYVSNGGFTRSSSSHDNELFINNGDLTFTNRAQEFEINDKGCSVQSCFFDMDRDGDLDLFVMNHSSYQKLNPLDFVSKMNSLSKSEYILECNHLYENLGNNKFQDISEQAGVLKPGFGLGLNCSDVNDDGLVDIYVANDFSVPDFLYINKGNKVFRDDIKKSSAHISYFSMGCDIADINNDGLLDISVVDMASSDHVRSKTLMASMDVQKFDILQNHLGYHPQFMFNALQMNVGNGKFSEISQYAGTSKTEWSWATLLADFDNDGLKDNFVSNGFRRDTKDNDYRIARRRLIDSLKNQGIPNAEINNHIFEHLKMAPSKPMPNYFYKNVGNFKFKDSGTKWGIKEVSFSNGAAYGDLDNDGDLDLVINNLDSEAFLYRNNSGSDKNYLQIVLKDSKTNDAGIYNARVNLHYGSNIINTQELTTVRGYLSSVDPVLHFGLDSVRTVKKIEIKWNDGMETILSTLKSNQRIEIDKAKSNKSPVNKKDLKTIFEDVTPFLKTMDFVHAENKFNDFESEILLPYKMSTLGPFISVGDVNGDFLSDFFIGGAKGQSGQIYLQNSRGHFDKLEQPAFMEDQNCEDMGSCFIDADKDGDLDLIVGSGGGGDVAEKKDLLRDRLYYNDGKGNFNKANTSLPEMHVSTSWIKPYDFNGDGYEDLFVGGRNTPGKYPHPTQSFLLANNKNGGYVNVTEKMIPELKNIGMVTDATWTDFNGDRLMDLVVVGEWMSIKFFKNIGDGTFQNVSEELGLGETSGLWMSIASADLDGDGDFDFVVGNLGENNKFKARKKKPLHIYCNDFDENQTQDIVLSTVYKDKMVPIRGKECSTEQMPFIAEKFPTYKSFATATLNEMYGNDKLENAIHYKTELLSSIFLINNGDATFTIKKLPDMAQISPINDVIIHDYNNDQFLDIILAGNLFKTEVETGQYDAGKGLVLRGKGNFNFETVPSTASGIFFSKDLKDMEPIVMHRQGRKFFSILGSNNDDKPQVFVQMYNDID